MALIAYSERYQDWQLGTKHPTNPERAKRAVELLMKDERVQMLEGWNTAKARKEWEKALLTVHDADYVSEILVDGECEDWTGKQTILGQTALTMFGGTHALVDEYLTGRDDHRVFFNPQGAKHHAGYDHSSGFCVFNDMVSAALRLTDAGKTVVYVDWDAHAGDGVEDGLTHRDDIWTISIHEGRLFPYSDNVCESGRWNYPLEQDAGDIELHESLREVAYFIREMSPDVVLVACGADGLDNDPLSSLRYTLDGMEEGARILAQSLQDVDATAIIGGAGGYQPLTETPEHWARTVKTFTDILEGK